MNGMSGTVMNYDSVKGRYAVKLATETNQVMVRPVKLVKPANLKYCDDGGAGSVPQEQEAAAAAAAAAAATAAAAAAAAAAAKKSAANRNKRAQKRTRPIS